MVDTEGEGPSEPLMLNEIELVFKPHPTEMAGDNSLIKALKENSIRYIKTTANATGEFRIIRIIRRNYWNTPVTPLNTQWYFKNKYSSSNR